MSKIILAAESENTINENKNKTLIKFYTDGSSDKILKNGGIEIFIQYLDNKKEKNIFG